MASLWELFVSITGDNSSYKKAIQESSEATDAFSAMAEAAGLKIGGALSFAGIAAGAVEMADKFEQASIQIQRTTGATGDVLDGMEKSFKTLYASSTASSEAIAGALSQIAQKTGATGDALEALTSRALQFAKVTSSDVNSAVDQTQKLFASWKVTTEQQSGALDILYVAAQKSGLSADQITASMITMKPVLFDFGFNFLASAAIIGTFGKAGLDATEITAGLTKAYGAFAKANEDPKQALIQLIERMRESETRAGALTEAIEYFGSKSAVKFSNAVNSGGFDLAAFTAALNNSTGAVANMAERTDTAGAKWTKFTRELGETLAPTGAAILTWTSGAIDDLKSLVKGTETTLTQIENSIKEHSVAARFLGLMPSLAPASGLSVGDMLPAAFKAFGALISGGTGLPTPKANIPPASIGDQGDGSSGGGAGGAADGAGGGLAPVTDFHQIKDLNDALALLVAQENLEIAAHKSVTEETAKFNEATGASVDQLEYLHIKTAVAVLNMMQYDDTLAPATSGTIAMAKEVGQAAKFVDALAGSQQDLLLSSPWGKLNEAAKFFGITTTDQFSKLSRDSQDTFDAMLKTGVATEHDLAVAALKTAQAEIDADYAAGKSSDEYYQKESKMIQADLAVYEGAAGKKTAILDKWSVAAIKATKDVGSALKTLGDMGEKAFGQLADGMGKNIAHAIIYSTSIGQAMRAALEATLESLASQAFAYAIFAGAVALLDLATGNFAGAAAAGEAAAMFAVVGIVTVEIAKAVAPKTGAAGGFANVPYDNMPVALHRNEMVLPADIAIPLRAMVASTPLGSGGMAFHNCTFSGVTRSLVRDVMTGAVRDSRLAGARY